MKKMTCLMSVRLPQLGDAASASMSAAGDIPAATPAVTAAPAFSTCRRDGLTPMDANDALPRPNNALRLSFQGPPQGIGARQRLSDREVSTCRRESFDVDTRVVSSP